MPVIAVCQQKGGSGKTTLALHLARGLQLDGHSVLLVDADPQRSALDWSRMQTGVGMPLTLPLESSDLSGEISGVRPDFEFVVIDGPPRLHDLLAAAIHAADLILIPTQTSAFDIRAAADVVNLFRSAHRVTPSKRAAFVVVRPVASSRLAGEIDEALSVFGLPVLRARLGNRVAYQSSVSEGLTVFETDRGRARAEAVALTAEVKALVQ